MAHKHLYHISEIPSFFHELFIETGYRHPRSSIRDCISSLFFLHNETLNIWTHLLPSLFYCWLCFADTALFDLTSTCHGYPMLIFLIAMSLFPFASCVAHIFNTLSEKARHICFFLDYFALSIFSISCAIAYSTYSFPRNFADTYWVNVYLILAFINSILSFILSCRTRFLDHGMQKKLFRILSFAVPYITDVLPITYRSFCDDIDWIGGQYYHVRQFLFAFLSAFLYSSHLPERLYPGKFDIVGHSHQIFHVVSMLGTYDSYVGMKLDMTERKQLLTHVQPPTFLGTWGLLSAVLLTNIIILFYYCSKLDNIILKSTSSDDLTKLHILCTKNSNLINGERRNNSLKLKSTNGVDHHKKSL